METILKYATQLRTELVRGGCPVDKLYMMDRLTYGDLEVIDLDPVEKAELANRDLVHKLIVYVIIRRAKQSYESSWGWKPEHYSEVQVGFYHWDFDKLLQLASEWLTTHDDTETGEYTQRSLSKTRRDTVVRTIKYPQLGRVRHYTNPLESDK